MYAQYYPWAVPANASSGTSIIQCSLFANSQFCPGPPTYCEPVQFGMVGCVLAYSVPAPPPPPPPSPPAAPARLRQGNVRRSQGSAEPLACSASVLSWSLRAAGGCWPEELEGRSAAPFSIHRLRRPGVRPTTYGPGVGEPPRCSCTAIPWVAGAAVRRGQRARLAGRA